MQRCGLREIVKLRRGPWLTCNASSDHGVALRILDTMRSDIQCKCICISFRQTVSSKAYHVVSIKFCAKILRHTVIWQLFVPQSFHEKKFQFRNDLIIRNLSRVDMNTFETPCCVRGYKDIWTAAVGEILFCVR